MKKKIYIWLFIFFVFVLSSINSFANKDTIAVIKLKNLILINNNTLSFDIFITRERNNWDAFANSTFQLGFDDSNFKFDDKNIECYLVSSDLNLSTVPGITLPTEEYLIEPKIFDNRISITIVGPEQYDDCIKIPLNKDVLLGKFIVRTKSNQPIPKQLIWLKPIDWYQACAFKLDRDSLIQNSIPFYYKNDNLNMDDGKSITYVFETESYVEDKFIFDDFWVYYIGQKVDSLGWSTREEKDVLGFTVKRGVKTSIFEIEYTEVVGTYDISSPKYNPGYVSKGYTKTGHIYDPFYDSVQYRGGQYCYALYATLLRKDGSKYDSLVAERCVNVPNAVISKAHPLENPFSDKTIIELHLDDDCYVDGFVTDEIGRFVKHLETPTGEKMIRTFMKGGINTSNPQDKVRNRGRYFIEFKADELSSQGLYNVVFIAYPINDINVEVSRAVVKLQYIRD